MTIYTFKLSSKRFQEILYNYASYDAKSQKESDTYMRNLSEEERKDFFSDLDKRAEFYRHVNY